MYIISVLIVVLILVYQQFEETQRSICENVLPDALTHACFVPLEASVESTKAPAGRFLLSTDVPLPRKRKEKEKDRGCQLYEI